MSDNLNILTFDIEEWFHILSNDSTRNAASWEQYETRIYSNVDRILELLDERNQLATFFCLGWIAKKYPDVLRRIQSQGHEIGTHSNKHQLVYEQSRRDFKNDLAISIDRIQNVTGQKVRAYRSPGFSIKEESKWAFECLIECGIEIDCSIYPARRGHGGFSSFPFKEPCKVEVNGHYLKEFPINTYVAFGYDVVFSGGGYFRFFPYWALNHMMKKSQYVMTYFHPRDFDADQPIIKGLSFERRFKSYYGLKPAFAKLKRLLSEHAFMDLRNADKIIDWDNAKKISVQTDSIAQPSDFIHAIPG